jgi:hypothetical protein
MSRPLEKGSISTNDGVPPLEQHFACGFMSCGGSWNRQPANSELLAMKESLARMMRVDIQVWFSIEDGRDLEFMTLPGIGFRKIAKAERPLSKLTKAATRALADANLGSGARRSNEWS